MVAMIAPVGRLPAGEATTPILSGCEIEYPPFCIVGEDGRAGGFSVELMRAALRAMNREVTFHTGPWAEVRGWLERGEVDALPLVGRTPEREDLFDFTVPYISLHGAIVVRQGNTEFFDIEDLRGRRVAVMKGDNAEEFLRRENRGITIHTTSTFEEALRDLSAGHYDAVITQRIVALRLIQETGLTNLTVIDRPIEGFRQDFCFAVKEGDRETLALLNEGLAIVIADGTYRHLHSKWFASLQLPTGRQIVVGGDRNYPPYEFLDKYGRPTGYNVDLTRAIAREMNLDIEIRLDQWTESVEDLKNGRIDVIQGMFYSPDRDLTFDFTPAHTVNHCIAVVREGEGPPPVSVADLAGKRVVVQRNDIMHDFVRKHGLESQIVAVGSHEEVLRQLSEGMYDCALVSRLTALYLIEKHGWPNLILGSKPLLSPEYCYATANDRNALLAQFSEGLKILEENGEYRRIFQKWIGVYKERPPSLLIAVRYSAMVLAPLLVFLLAAFAWSWSLRRQVAERTGELRESLDRFQYVFESANVGKSLTKPTGEIHANKAFADCLGYAPEELENKTWRDVTAPEDIETTEESLAPLLRGEKDSTRLEKRFLHRDGSRVWADVSVRMRRDGQGRPLYFVITFVDITERKRAEKALRESEELQRAMIACSPVALYSVDEHGQVMSWNSSAERIFGWSAEEVLGLPLPIVPENKRGEFEALRRQVLGGGAFTGKELTRLRKDGTLIPISLSVAPIRNDLGEVVGIMAAAEDISERKRVEAERERLQTQLNQAQKMESVGRLAGGVAHDFNNILQAIMGYSEILQERLPEGEETHEFAGEIARGVDRASMLTRQLLAFARRQTIRPIVLDLNDVVESMLRMLRRLIGEDIDLAWLPQAGLWAVKIDPVQVDQILANLCVNARDAIAGVGKVTIETANVTFDDACCVDHPGFTPGDFVRLAVSDDGCGMDKQTCEKIFEPFFTTKDLDRGTGLGLATVYGIVRQNDGHINVYSEPGQGATFKVYLPRHLGSPQDQEEIRKPEIQTGRGETILLVEDEESILELGDRMLRSLGYEVFAFGAPREALEFARNRTGPIHLLITDVVMPEMNGRDLAEHLCAVHPEIKTLFMSGYTANVIVHRGVLDEGVRFIQKPFSVQALASRVRESLEED